MGPLILWISSAGFFCAAARHTHKPALHTGSGATGFCRDADPNPKQGFWMVHDKKEGWRDLLFSAFRSPPLIFLSSAVHVLEPAWLCYLRLAFAYSHQGEIKPGKMQKCCRTVGASKDLSGITGLTAQLSSETSTLWSKDFSFTATKLFLSALISSPYSKVFFRTILISVGKVNCEFRNHPVFCEELGC